MNFEWCETDWSALGTWVGAVANFLLAGIAMLAIWNWKPSPRLSIVPFEDFKPHPIWGHQAHWIGMKVVNTGWSDATNCHVFMTNAWRKNPTGDFIRIPMPFPMLFSWTPSEWPQMNLLLKKGGDWRFDLAAIKKGSSTLDFSFLLNPRPADFTGSIKPNETLMLEIQAESDQICSSQIYVEVCWNGKWEDDSGLMQNHVKVMMVDRPKVMKPLVSGAERRQ